MRSRWAAVNHTVSRTGLDRPSRFNHVHLLVWSVARTDGTVSLFTNHTVHSGTNVWAGRSAGRSGASTGRQR